MKHRPGTLRVLVVDDNRDAADTLALLLRLWGHEVRVAYDGASGLAAALEFRPDAAVLDVAMPGLDGGQVAERLRGTPGLENMLLVAATGTDPRDPRVAGRHGFFDHYLRKPYNLDQLEALLGARAAELPR
jgi:DNA-binding response OmpR family regulator